MVQFGCSLDKKCLSCGNGLIRKPYMTGRRDINQAIYCSNKCSRNNFKLQAQNFFSRVTKTKSCWIWSGCKDNGGYGLFGFKNKVRKAHRFSWFVHYGEFPKLNVLHKCDNPPCVNPDHLFLGTQKDNILDCKNKGRMRTKPQKGEENGMVKLTGAEVLKMRSIRMKSELSYKKLAKKFNVSTMTAFRAVTKQLWRHL